MKLDILLYVNNISDEFDNGIDSMVIFWVMALCYFNRIGPCEHDNLSKYEWILMILNILLYIYNISDEFGNGVDRIVIFWVMALCSFNRIGPCEHDNLSKYWQIWIQLDILLYVNNISDEFDNGIDSIVIFWVMALCYFNRIGPCEHDNLSKYEWISVKLDILLYIHDILDEIDNGVDSIEFTELWPFANH